MLASYTWPRFAYRAPAEVAAATPRRVPLVVVGAGLVGLTAAIDAALRGVPVLLLDDDNTVSVGSRAVCHAKRTLEIFDRLGLGGRIVERGVTWNVGRTFHRQREVFSFNLLPEAGHLRPGMVNLQQYHVEQILVERALELPAIDLRWQHRVASVSPHDDGVLVDVDTADGRYCVHADWLIAADGSRSGIRGQLGLDCPGHAYPERFLIADVVLDAEPFALERSERRFWFAPPFHEGGSALMHRQADNVWRLDFQLGADADAALEQDPARVQARVRALLDLQGFAHIGFALEWVSVYSFQCRRMDRFRHGRVLFAGDAAHQMSPFGARGGNSGVQDADNLGWKLALVIAGLAPAALLDSYVDERGAAADDNLVNARRSTDFMTPKTHAARVLRDAVLSLAADVPAARALVNSGRLSVPTPLLDSTLNTPDIDAFDGWMRPGAPLDDAPVRTPNGRDGWLLPHTGAAFVLLRFGAPDAVDVAAIDALRDEPVPVHPLFVVAPGDDAAASASSVIDADGWAARRCDARPGTIYLIRPDQHVAARWRHFDVEAVRAALARATRRSVQ